MAQNLGSKKEFLRQVEEQNKESRQPKKGFTTKESPIISATPGMKKGNKK